MKEFKSIRKDRHDVNQKDDTAMFIIEVPEIGIHQKVLYKLVKALGYVFNDERLVWEYKGKE